MAKILVTGGAGFIGGHIVRALLRQGQTLVVLDDLSNGKRENIPHGPNIEFIHADVADMAAVRKAMTGCDHVVHLAALVSVPLSIEHPQKTFTTNVTGTYTILEIARELKLPGNLIYASSAAVYGRLDQARTAEREAYGVPLPSPYAASKASNEVLGRMYNDVYKLRTVGLRFFNVYGPGQDATSPYSGVLSRLVHCIDSGETFTVFGDGSQTRDFVAVSDVVTVVSALLARPPEMAVPQVMNLGSGVGVSIMDMVRQVVALKRLTPVLRYTNAREGDVRLSCADITLLRQVLPGWNPQSLQTGLKAWLL